MMKYLIPRLGKRDFATYHKTVGEGRKRLMDDSDIFHSNHGDMQ